jgi:hypothetical protein
MHSLWFSRLHRVTQYPEPLARHLNQVRTPEWRLSSTSSGCLRTYLESEILPAAAKMLRQLTRSKRFSAPAFRYNRKSLMKSFAYSGTQRVSFPGFLFLLELRFSLPVITIRSPHPAAPDLEYELHTWGTHSCLFQG